MTDRGGTFWLRFNITLGAGLLVFMAALDCGLPVWRDFPIGDATDFGVITAFIVRWFLQFIERHK